MQHCSEEIAHLERLRAELNRHGLDAQLVTKGKRACLMVANADIPEINERVLCQSAEDHAACFWWPWQQPIGSVDDLDAVAGKIAVVLRTVQGQP